MPDRRRERFLRGQHRERVGQRLWPHMSGLSGAGCARHELQHELSDHQHGQQPPAGHVLPRERHMLCGFRTCTTTATSPRARQLLADGLRGSGVRGERGPSAARAGWCDTVAIDSNTHGRATAASRAGPCTATEPANSRESFMIEAGATTCATRRAARRGLSIWHIDEWGDNDYEQMTEAQHYEASIEQPTARRTRAQRQLGRSERPVSPGQRHQPLRRRRLAGRRWLAGRTAGRTGRARPPAGHPLDRRVGRGDGLRHRRRGGRGRRPSAWTRRRCSRGGRGRNARPTLQRLEQGGGSVSYTARSTRLAARGPAGAP